MVEMHFQVANAEEAAYAFLSITNGESICGELEDHGGIMGAVEQLSWYVALIQPSEITGAGILSLLYEDTTPPSATVMRVVFKLLDEQGIKAISIPKPTPQEYPELYEALGACV